MNKLINFGLKVWTLSLSYGLFGALEREMREGGGWLLAQLDKQPTVSVSVGQLGSLRTEVTRRKKNT